MTTTLRDDDAHALVAWESLGRAGLLVSVCCGPSGARAFQWSVDVMTRDGASFHRPFSATTFAQAIDIALKETRTRGWR